MDEKYPRVIRELARVGQRVAILRQRLNRNAGIILALSIGVTEIKRISIDNLNKKYLGYIEIHSDVRKTVNDYVMPKRIENAMNGEQKYFNVYYSLLIGVYM